ncbi:hypothetical protein GFL38_10540 [Rhizobium leguminosarum bv. viciae]|uniref:hypothetical protein n=1 Tax=Rhizobium ruizarguesonis TaxID=2081791 RepID=UPI00143F4524|nr:hypothetical protein [Rhizobium ruizarguesonis]NKJ72702.1 hypothetical protein [Rhizobium leguminosarum bv. viciae]NKQ80381.1 hypothetical protein [Rhizobium ruizarguesonis]
MDNAVDTALAPLDELIELLPKIEKAKERARLGTALQKSTMSAERYDHFPALIDGLVTLVEAADADFEAVRSEIGFSLIEIIKMSRILSGEPTIDQLDAINQIGLTRLPLEIEKIENYVEGAWRKAVQDALGGQAALGEVLTNIPGVEALGRDLLRLAARTKKLEDASRPAADRVKERNALVAEASALSDRLLGVGIAPPIANFLVAVAARPVRLSELTDEILGWIRDHQALPLFTVSAHGAT